MSSGNLQYRDSGRGGDIVFSWRVLKIFSAVFTMIGALSLFLFWQVSFSFSQSNSVVINEMMYDPVSSEGCDDSSSEWVELENLNNAAAVTLSGWFIKDATTTKRQFSAEIRPGGYLVLVANKTCFLKNHGGVEDAIIVDLGAKIGSGLNNTDSDKDGVADRVILLDGVGVEKDSVVYAENAADEGKSYAFDGAVWREANPTPGAENSFPKEETKDQQQSPQPTITFSSPSTVSVGAPFSVAVTLKNFKSGTYSLKVLIGKGDKFYDGRTKGTNGEWLAWNAGWADFPKIIVNSSGSGSGTVQAKTDDDIVAGNYLTKVRAYDGKNTSDSDTKPLKVTGSSAPKSSSSGSEGKTQDLGGSTGEGGEAEKKGEVKGAGTSQGEGFKLNFYTILGIFGLLVGSGGFMLAFRRGAQRRQTPDTPESEPATPS